MSSKKQKTEHKSSIVSEAEWIQARKDLLEKENEFSHARAALAKQRQSLPWHEIKEDYELQTVVDTGNSEIKTLKFSALFENDEDTVIVWHFMFSGGQNGCHLCSFFLDGINGIYRHVKPRANFCAIAIGPVQDLEVVKVKKGWEFPLYSCAGTSFAHDYGAAFTDDQVKNGTAVYNYDQTWKYGNTAPGLSVFCKKEGKIFHTYSTYAAGLADLNSTFNLLDCIPEGRNEKDQGNMWWVKHKEMYVASTGHKDEDEESS
mmetsp:Transcript_162/g.434  ORF Transcript_162/g.434 Transcript_162/m.434 type:complete len:260 (-) Transcript_162:1943-2722(-)